MKNAWDAGNCGALAQPGRQNRLPLLFPRAWLEVWRVFPDVDANVETGSNVLPTHVDLVSNSSRLTLALAKIAARIAAILFKSAMRLVNLYFNLLRMQKAAQLLPLIAGAAYCCSWLRIAVERRSWDTEMCSNHRSMVIDLLDDGAGEDGKGDGRGFTGR